MLHDTLYIYMHVHINMCKYQWEEFGGQPQGSCSFGLQRTIAASRRKSLLLFDHVITNGQYSHSEGDRCLWPHIRGINPLKNASDHVSRFYPSSGKYIFHPPIEYFQNIFYGVKQDYYRLGLCRRSF